MADATKLQCVYCWVTSPTDGRSTHCQHCGQPLHLTDGRRVIDVMALAKEQAAAYKAAGYDPAVAPAAAEAKAVLSPRRKPTNFVSVVRWVMALSVFVAVLQITLEAWQGHPSDPYYLPPGPILLITCAVIVAIAAVFIWLARWMLVRIAFLGAALYGIVVGNSATSSYWLLASLVMTVLYAIALALSVVYPPPPKRWS